MTRNLRLVAHQARYDFIAFRRNRQAVFFTVLLPVMFLVIFVSVFGNDTIGPHGVRAATYYVPGISAMSLIAAAFINLVISITMQRESGVLKRRRATPVPAWVLIAGRTLTAIVIGVGVMAVVMVIGRIAYGVRLPGATIPGLLLTSVIGAICFCCLGYALGSAVNSSDAAQPMVQAIMLPLYFISGIFIPNVNLPPWLRDTARVFPVEHLASGLHRSFDPTAAGSGIVWSDLAVLAIWAVAGLGVALWRFTWLPAAAR